jgi:hypothetical protein
MLLGAIVALFPGAVQQVLSAMTHNINNVVHGLTP